MNWLRRLFGFAATRQHWRRTGEHRERREVLLTGWCKVYGDYQEVNIYDGELRWVRSSMFDLFDSSGDFRGCHHDGRFDRW